MEIAYQLRFESKNRTRWCCLALARGCSANSVGTSSLFESKIEAGHHGLPSEINCQHEQNRINK